MKQIFIIEDSQDYQYLLRTILMEEGYDVECASNGLEALDKLRARSNNPCMIFLDIMMPIMDGFEFREQQKKDPRLADIPVVVMTAHADVMAAKAKIGVREIIKKPSDINVFLKAAQTYC